MREWKLRRSEDFKSYLLVSPFSLGLSFLNFIIWGLVQTRGFQTVLHTGDHFRLCPEGPLFLPKFTVEEAESHLNLFLHNGILSEIYFADNDLLKKMNITTLDGSWVSMQPKYMVLETPGSSWLNLGDMQVVQKPKTTALQHQGYASWDQKT